MAILLMNGELAGTAYAATTWRELLQVLDEECAGRDEVIAAVQLGGADVPAFRVPEVLAQELDAGAEVVIETARPADLICQTLDEADGAACAIGHAAAGLAASYRAADVVTANQALPGFAEHLGTLIVVTSTAAHGAGVNLSTVSDGGMSATQMIDALIVDIEALLAAQRAGDWTLAADVIDIGIAATLRRWPGLLAAIRQASPALAGAA
jgi:hypothetical protein